MEIKCKNCTHKNACDNWSDTSTFKGICSQFKLDWTSTKVDLPDVSGDYLTIRKVKGTDVYIQYVYSYSAKHKAFNAFDSSDKAICAIEVDYWMPLPNTPVKGGSENES